MIETENIVFHHKVPAQLRFSDVDNYGHINNSVYFSLFDTCKAKYFTEILGDYIFEHIGVVVANIQADFIAPVLFHEEIEIQTAVSHLGNKSFTLIQRAVDVEKDEVKCQCQTIMVTVSLPSAESIEIPETFRNKIKEYEQSAEL